MQGTQAGPLLVENKQQASNIFNSISNRIDPDSDVFMVNMKDTVDTLCRMLVKNFDIFLNLFFYQHQMIFSKYTPNTFDLDAGDVYNNFICLPDDPSGTKVLLADKDFKQLTFMFVDCLTRASPRLNTFTESYTSDVEKMWQCCKYLIIPVRVNYETIPPSERENMLRKWLSTVFTLPFCDLYTNRYKDIYPEAILTLQRVYGLFKIGDKANEPIFNEQKIIQIKSLDEKLIKAFTGPIQSAGMADRIFRIYMMIVLLGSGEIIKKWCPNILECKKINPGFKGVWLKPFDILVNPQLARISKITQDLTPRQ